MSDTDSHAAALQRANSEIERRVRAAADELLRSEWGAHAAAAVPARASEYAQILEDVSSTSRLNQPDLLAEYLEVMASTEYGVETSRDANLSIARKLIAVRRDTEIEVLPASWIPSNAREPEAPRGPIAKTWKFVSAAIVIFFALCLALAGVAVLWTSSGLATGERLALGIGLIVTAAALVPLFLYGEKWRRDANRRVWQRTVRRGIEKQYENKP